MESAPSKTLEAVIRELARLDSELAHHHRFVTILFADIVDSTRFFDEHGDVAGLVMVQRCLDMLTPIVERHKGVVVKTIGDALMVRFGRPDAAVRCAMAMQRALADRNEQWSGSEQIHIRVAVHLGLALLKENDVLGDVVNVAARIEKVTEADTISISPSVYEQIRHISDLPVRQKASGLAIKGKSERMDLYEVLWSEAAASYRIPQIDELALAEVESPRQARRRSLRRRLQRARLKLRAIEVPRSFALAVWHTRELLNKATDYATASVQSASGWTVVAVVFVAAYLSVAVAFPTLQHARKVPPANHVTSLLPATSPAYQKAAEFGATTHNIAFKPTEGLSAKAVGLRKTLRQLFTKRVNAPAQPTQAPAVQANTTTPPATDAANTTAAVQPTPSDTNAPTPQLSKDQLALGVQAPASVSAPAPPPSASADPDSAASSPVPASNTVASAPKEAPATIADAGFAASIRVHHRHKMFKQCTGVLQISPERVVFKSEDMPEHNFDVPASRVTDFQTDSNNDIHLKVDGRSYNFSRDTDSTPTSAAAATTPTAPQN